MILNIQKDIKFVDISQLMENAKKDLGGEVPEYMKEIFEIINKRNNKIKNKDIFTLVNYLRFNGSYTNAIRQLTPSLMEEDDNAFFILNQMIRNKEMFEIDTMLEYHKLFYKLKKKFGDKYQYFFPFKVSYV
jgi:hypothetical protein